MSTREAAIGGYFGLESTAQWAPEWMKRAIGFQSARAALCALLSEQKPDRLWIPGFICGAVQRAAEAAGTRTARYALDPAFGVPDHLPIDTGDWILTVDYFGLCGPTVERTIRKVGPHRVIVDASQSLFYKPDKDTQVVLSPRKFLGVPDGGWLLSPRSRSQPIRANEVGSQRRMSHLIARSSGDLVAGLRMFREAEASLEDCGPVAMSTLTRAMLTSINYSSIALKRISNFDFLASKLDPSRQSIRRPEDSVPLCFPFAVGDARKAREMLAERGIFCPAYWPDAEVGPNDVVGDALLNRTLYLPCDQRYDDVAMLRIVRAVDSLGETR